MLDRRPIRFADGNAVLSAPDYQDRNLQIAKSLGIVEELAGTGSPNPCSGARTLRAIHVVAKPALYRISSQPFFHPVIDLPDAAVEGRHIVPTVSGAAIVTARSAPVRRIFITSPSLLFAFAATTRGFFRLDQTNPRRGRYSSFFSVWQWTFELTRAGVTSWLVCRRRKRRRHGAVKCPLEPSLKGRPGMEDGPEHVDTPSGEGITG